MRCDTIFREDLEEKNMKKLKRLLALIIASVMVFSLAGCGSRNTGTDPTEAPTTEAPTSGQNDEQKTELSVNLHYLREDGNYENWNVWLWAEGAGGAAYQFGTDTDENGVTANATFTPGTSKIGFIVRLGEWESKDFDGDQFIEINGVLAGTVDVYVKSGIEGYELKLGDDCVKGLGIYFAEMKSDFKTIRVKFTEEFKVEGNTVKILDAEGREVAADTIVPDETDAKYVTVTLKDKADELGTYKIEVNGLSFDVDVPDYFSTEDFESKYTYDGDDLGATWSKSSTTFKVWAPTAKNVKLNTYEAGEKGKSDLIKSYDMTAEEKGVWTVKVDGDLNGTYYTYEVDGTEACDPYARAVGVNGDRAMVIDMDSTDPEGWDKDKNPNSGLNSTDAVIYEVHIRDLSADSSSGIKNVGKYLGFTETGTTNATGQTTGISHIKDLGITHIQIGPAYDYATVDETKLDKAQYNWGYDPKNYNVPEGSYSTDPYNGEVRIEEFKEMVKSIHDNGMSVVMDVVYNHTYDTNYCFNQIVPGYFYRPDSNGSGCGNDVASERSMVSKFIVDSVVYWAEEYHIDGFRFDLVGLIDTATIREIRERLDEIDPSIILYGEGWSMSTAVTKSSSTMATQTTANKLEGFGFFNDTIRDAIKGSVFNETEKGYINGNFSKTSVIRDSIMGKTSWSNKGSAQIMYSTCHDNRTLWDEIQLSNPDDSEADQIKQYLMSAAIVYTSQGTPFILAGEEILRSKPNGDGTYNHNSYNASDAVNSIKWATLNEEKYQTVFSYYKGMIAFRKAHASFRVMDIAAGYYTQMKDLDEGVIAYELKGVEGEVSDSIFAIYNANTNPTTITLPEGTWTICVQGDKAGTESLGTASGNITVDGITTTILVKGALK